MKTMRLSALVMSIGVAVVCGHVSAQVQEVIVGWEDCATPARQHYSLLLMSDQEKVGLLPTEQQRRDVINHFLLQGEIPVLFQSEQEALSSAVTKKIAGRFKVYVPQVKALQESVSVLDRAMRSTAKRDDAQIQDVMERLANQMQWLECAVRMDMLVTPETLRIDQELVAALNAYMEFVARYRDSVKNALSRPQGLVLEPVLVDYAVAKVEYLPLWHVVALVDKLGDTLQKGHAVTEGLVDETVAVVRGALKTQLQTTIEKLTLADEQAYVMQNKVTSLSQTKGERTAENTSLEAWFKGQMQAFVQEVRAMNIYGYQEPASLALVEAVNEWDCAKMVAQLDIFREALKNEVAGLTQWAAVLG